MKKGIREWELGPVLEQLEKMEAQMAILDDKITAIQTVITKLGTDLAKVVTDLHTALANGAAPTPAQLTALDDIVTKLTAVDVTAVTE
jgi:hypothetical protein